MPRAVQQASPVLVLGMHRSGTSCLAGALQQAGLHLGEVSTANKHNPKGNRERDDVRQLNDAVLAANGYAWNAPPPADAPPLEWSAEQSREQARVLASLARQGLPHGLKDPRLLLVLDAWLNAAPGAACAGTFRHPAAVVASLRKRQPRKLDEVTVPHCADLWVAYNTRLLAQVRATGMPLVSFDWPDARYLSALRAMAEALNLPQPAAIAGFFDRTLRHTHDPEIALPEAALDLWSDLTARSIAS